MKQLKFEYKNWKDEVAIRRVVPKSIWFGSTEYHKEEQWFMKAFDISKHEERDFAMKDIIRFLQE